jgi:hypothetical protein
MEQILDPLMQRFIVGKLSKEEWTHEAHLGCAVWHLWQFTPDDAHQLIRKRILQHNENVGTPNSDTQGYHETITWFWLRNIRHFLKQAHYRSPEEAWQMLKAAPEGASTFPLKFFSQEKLDTVEARKEIVAPDLQQAAWL